MIGPVLASVHLAPAIGVPVAAVVGLGLGWLFLRLGRVGVPPIRRRIRRTATLLMMLALVAGLVGASLADPSLHPTRYVAAWAIVLLSMLLLVLIAGLDLLASSWLITLEDDGEAMRTGMAALQALEAEAARRDEAAGDEAGGASPAPDPPSERSS